MKNRMIVFLWLFVSTIVIVFLVFFYMPLQRNGAAPCYRSSAGIFDFSGCQALNRQFFELKGDVYFYPGKLLVHEDRHTGEESGQMVVSSIPSKWNAFQKSSGGPSGHGYGSYHFLIIVPENAWYGFKISDYKLAYSIIVNGEKLGGTGQVGKTREEMIPSRSQKEFFYFAESDTMDVILQVSNFHHRKGGATGSIHFGKSENIITYKVRMVGIEAFLIGLTFILFIYHLALYTYRRKDRSILYFSLLCLFMCFRTGYIGERIFLELMSFLGWSISTKLEYISFMCIPIFTVLFIQSLFPKEVPGWLVKVVVWPAGLFIAVILFLNSTTYSYTSLAIQSVIGPASAYLVIRVIIAVYRKREYSIQVFIGFFIFFLLSLYDAISYAGSMDNLYLMPVGLFVVAFSQAYVLAQKSSNAHSKAEQYAKELNEHAKQLEDLVEERTREISLQKAEIEKQKINIEEKAEELRSSNDSLRSLVEFKNNMTSMMVHDLKNPLNNIIGFTSLPGNIEKYKKTIHQSGWSMLNLIENILDIEKSETSEISLRLESFGLKALVDETFKNLQFMYEKAGMLFINDLDTNTQVYADKNIISRVFSNILSNAAKYSGKKGHVRVYTEESFSKADQKFVKIVIYNDGEPIPSGKLEAIFEKYNQVKHIRERGYHSTGIGLAFCKLAINAHGGEIGATSGKEFGVGFWFTLRVL